MLLGRRSLIIKRPTPAFDVIMPLQTFTGPNSTELHAHNSKFVKHALWSGDAILYNNKLASDNYLSDFNPTYYWDDPCGDDIQRIRCDATYGTTSGYVVALWLRFNKYYKTGLYFEVHPTHVYMLRYHNGANNIIAQADISLNTSTPYAIEFISEKIAEGQYRCYGRINGVVTLTGIAYSSMLSSHAGFKLGGDESINPVYADNMYVESFGIPLREVAADNISGASSVQAGASISVNTTANLISPSALASTAVNVNVNTAAAIVGAASLLQAQVSITSYDIYTAVNALSGASGANADTAIDVNVVTTLLSAASTVQAQAAIILPGVNVSVNSLSAGSLLSSIGRVNVHGAVSASVAASQMVATGLVDVIGSVTVLSAVSVANSTGTIEMVVQVDSGNAASIAQLTGMIDVAMLADVSSGPSGVIAAVLLSADFVSGNINVLKVRARSPVLDVGARLPILRARGH